MWPKEYFNAGIGIHHVPDNSSGFAKCESNRARVAVVKLSLVDMFLLYSNFHPPLLRFIHPITPAKTSSPSCTATPLLTAVSASVNIWRHVDSSVWRMPS